MKAQYFPHDFNARGDEKMVDLLMQMGAEGYGLYWLIVEKLYEAHGRLSRNFALIGHDLHSDSEKIKRVVDGFGLFYKSDDGKIASKSVDRRIKERNEKTKVSRASANVRWGNAGAMPTHSEGNAINKGNKVKKGNKEIKNVLTPPTPLEVTEYARSIGFQLDGQQFHDYYQTRGWSLKGNVKMKDWRAAVRTWRKNEGFGGGNGKSRIPESLIDRNPQLDRTV